MTRLRWLSFIAVVIAPSLAGGASSVQAPSPVQSSRLIVGVVRGDTTLLPLASKENEAWTILRSFDRGLFRLLDAQRVPREGWTYVPWGAGVPRPLAVLDMVTTDAYCSRQEGFATNAPPPSPKLDAPHLMSGIAIHGDVSAVRIEDVVHQPDARSRRVAQFVVQLTHALEAERASVPLKSPRTTIPSNGRERVPVQITTLARDRVGDVDYYYFEAHKRYGAVESYANGWLASSPFSVSVVSAAGGIYGGGATARRRGRVLSVLRIGRASVWVMEMRGYEGDSYDIVEMPRTGQVLSVHGGGC
jgi:hypothetical protein